MNPGESYDPLLMSLVKFNQCRWRGGDWFKEGFLSLEMIEILILCAIQRVNGQDKRLKCLWTGYGSRYQAHWLCQELQRCWGFHAQQFPVCIKDSPPPNGHPANLTQLCEALESTWASIPVERFRHLVESIPRPIEAVLRGKGGATQYQGVPNVFITLSVWW